MKIACLAFFLVLMLPQGALFSETPENSQTGEDHVEKYQYEAVPVGEEAEREEIEMGLSFENDGIGFTSTSVSEKAVKRIQVKMTRDGDLITGTEALPTARGALRRRRYGETITKRISSKIPAGTKRPKPLIFPKGQPLPSKAPCSSSSDSSPMAAPLNGIFS